MNLRHNLPHKPCRFSRPASPWCRTIVCVVVAGLLLIGQVSSTELRIVSIQQVGSSNTWRVSWTAVAGRNYQLQRAGSLAGNGVTNWISVLTLQATGTVATADDIAAPRVMQNFYRVLEVTNSLPDNQPPTIAFSDAQMATTTNGGPAIELIFGASDNVGVTSVTVF